MIYIRVQKETKRFINKCLQYNISLFDITYHDDELIVLIDEHDLEEIKRINYYSNIEIIRYTGFKRFILNVKRYAFDIFLLCFLCLSLYIISNFIITIDIRHENKHLKEEINDILKSKGITPFQFKKDFKELNNISDEILRENRDILDWIAIDREGMHYVVSFEERILTSKEEDLPYCDVVASKDGVISKINATSGVIMVEKGMYVRKGDILISGTIMNNDEVKDYTCAKGTIEAEVWYKIGMSIPLAYEKKVYTDNKRYNFSLNGNYLFKKKYEHYDKDKLFALGPFVIYQEKEYTIEVKKHSLNEAKEEGIKLAEKRLLESLDKKSRLIDQKVLKEEVNDSKIELELFMSVQEDIGLQSTEKAGEEDDTE